jgi:hypothetical protein
VQHILHRKNAQVRHRSRRRSHHRPHNLAVMLDRLKIRLHVGSLDIGRPLTPPTQRRIVVVRPRVCHRVWNVAVRKIQMRAAIREPKLQNPHPRHIKVLAQLIHLGRNQAKILRNKRQIAEDLLQPLKQFVPRSLHPLPVDRSLFLGRNRPVRLEATEVVQTNHVIQRQRAPNPRHPPVETALLHQPPPI